MSKFGKDLIEGLTEAVEFARGNKGSAREHIVEVLAACRSEMRRVIVDHSWQQRASGAFAGFRTDRSGCWIGDAACFRTARASGGS